MILVDFSSVIHRKLYNSISKIKPKKIDGQYITSEFINLTKFYIFQELFDIKREHEAKYGDLVICVDNKAREGYWRRDVDPGYKSKRKEGREISEINFEEVFVFVNDIIEQLTNNCPWPVIDVHRAEADDIILVLAREFSKSEKVMIHSPDKDMLQSQRNTKNVQQYSAMTGKWLIPEIKNDNMDDWINEHICLGDVADQVPKVVDHTEFSPAFIKYLEDNDIEEHDPVSFKASDVPVNIKTKLINDFDVWKLNRKGESIGVKDIYLTMRFGPSHLKKALAKHGSLDGWLDTHPLYRKHYERNFTLVMEEGIPDYIRNGIIESYRTAGREYNPSALEEYLKTNGLNSVIMELPNVFKLNRELVASDFDW